jgi:hypothetical protein
LAATSRAEQQNSGIGGAAIRTTLLPHPLPVRKIRYSYTSLTVRTKRGNLISYYFTSGRRYECQRGKWESLGVLQREETDSQLQRE